jgi:hypothetical protein
VLVLSKPVSRMQVLRPSLIGIVYVGVYRVGGWWLAGSCAVVSLCLGPVLGVDDLGADVTQLELGAGRGVHLHMVKEKECVCESPGEFIVYERRSLQDVFARRRLLSPPLLCSRCPKPCIVNIPISIHLYLYLMTRCDVPSCTRRGSHTRGPPCSHPPTPKHNDNEKKLGMFQLFS